MTKNKAVMLIAAGFVFATPAALTAAAPKLAETRSTLKEWVELKKLISEERSDWAVEKQTLQESIDLLESEISKLTEAIDKAEEESSAADRQRQELNAEEEALKQASAVVKQTIGDLEEMTLNIVEYLPEVLQNKLTVVTQRIPKSQREVAASTLSVRIMNVIGVLTEIEKFNSQITVENGIEEIDGVRMNVDTLYLGLAVAYYVDGPGKTAGYMIPAKNGWKKVQDNSLAPAVSAAVAMQKREATAEFVNLPLEVTDVE